MAGGQNGQGGKPKFPILTPLPGTGTGSGGAGGGKKPPFNPFPGGTIPPILDPGNGSGGGKKPPFDPFPVVAFLRFSIRATAAETILREVATTRPVEATILPATAETIPRVAETAAAMETETVGDAITAAANTAGRTTA